MTDLIDYYMRSQVDKGFLIVLQKMADVQENGISLTRHLTQRMFEVEKEMKRRREVELSIAQAQNLISQLKGGETK